MLKNNAHRTARIMTLFSLSVLLFLSACAGGPVSQVEVNRPDELLAARQSALTDQQGLAKAAAPAGDPATAPLGAPAGQPLAVDPLMQPSAAQAAAPQDAAQPLAQLPAPAQAVAADPSLPIEPRIGARAPQFSLQTVDGQSLNLDSLIGHPVVISYWATWCIPCQQELPILQKLHQEYANSGLVVLTVNAIEQDSLEDVQAMLAEKGMTLPVLLDEGSAFASDYQAMFFPTTFYIDPSGVIRFIKLGDSSEQDLRTHVDSLMRGEL